MHFVTVGADGLVEDQVAMIQEEMIEVTRAADSSRSLKVKQSSHIVSIGADGFVEDQVSMIQEDFGPPVMERSAADAAPEPSLEPRVPVKLKKTSHSVSIGADGLVEDQVSMIQEEAAEVTSQEDLASPVEPRVPVKLKKTEHIVSIGADGFIEDQVSMVQEELAEVISVVEKLDEATIVVEQAPTSSRSVTIGADGFIEDEVVSMIQEKVTDASSMEISPNGIAGVVKTFHDDSDPHVVFEQADDDDDVVGLFQTEVETTMASVSEAEAEAMEIDTTPILLLQVENKIISKAA